MTANSDSRWIGLSAVTSVLCGVLAVVTMRRLRTEAEYDALTAAGE